MRAINRKESVTDDRRDNRKRRIAERTSMDCGRRRGKGGGVEKLRGERGASRLEGR